MDAWCGRFVWDSPTGSPTEASRVPICRENDADSRRLENRLPVSYRYEGSNPSLSVFLVDLRFAVHRTLTVAFERLFTHGEPEATMDA